jgi:hypothetical protein
LDWARVSATRIESWRCGFNRSGSSFPFLYHFACFGHQNVAGFVAQQGDAGRLVLVTSLVFGEAEELVFAIESPENLF